MGHPRPLFHFFLVLKTTVQCSKQINVKNDPSSIRYWDLNPRLLDQFLPITRAHAKLSVYYIKTKMSTICQIEISQKRVSSPLLFTFPSTFLPHFEKVFCKILFSMFPSLLEKSTTSVKYLWLVYTFGMIMQFPCQFLEL